MSSRLRIGILTFHRCINYGAYWQARCLVQGLRAAGHDAVLLDHDSDRVNRAEWRRALQPQRRRRMPASERNAYKIKARRVLDGIKALPRSACFRLDRPETMEPCDIVVVGSNEVWNPAHPWYGSSGLFYGDGLNAGRLISYAASFGNHDASAGLDSASAARLRGFAAISVRDENSQRLVDGALGRTPDLVLDPVLQFPPAPPGHGTGEEHIIVYGHSFPAWFAMAVRQWAARRGSRLISLGYRNDWADEQLVSAGPEDFAGMISRAGAVVTNNFHGCAFALLNARRLACTPSAGGRSKVRDLARALGAERHIVDESGGARTVDDALADPPAARIAARIARLRYQSSRYLSQALA